MADEFTSDANTVALYHLDNSPSDSGPNSLTLTENSTNYSSTTKEVGTHSVQFPNSNNTDWLENAGTDSAWDFATSDFTIEHWFKTSYHQNGRYSIEKKASSGSTTRAWGIYFWNNGGAAIGFGANLASGLNRGVGNCTTSGSLGVDDGGWHHVAVVRQGTTTRLYLDGVQRDTDTGVSASGYQNTNDPFYIGRHWTGSTYEYLASGVSGEFFIDEVRISNIARYPDGTTFTPGATVTLGVRAASRAPQIRKFRHRTWMR